MPWLCQAQLTAWESQAEIQRWKDEYRDPDGLELARKIDLRRRDKMIRQCVATAVHPCRCATVGHLCRSGTQKSLWSSMWMNV